MASLAVRWFVLLGCDVGRYDELDERILAEIGSEPKPFKEIYLSCSDEPSRVFDRRLQVLRKKGLISAVKGNGWVKVA